MNKVLNINWLLIIQQTLLKFEILLLMINVFILKLKVFYRLSAIG